MRGRDRQRVSPAETLRSTSSSAIRSKRVYSGDLRSSSFQTLDVLGLAPAGLNSPRESGTEPMLGAAFVDHSHCFQGQCLRRAVMVPNYSNREWLSPLVSSPDWQFVHRRVAVPRWSRSSPVVIRLASRVRRTRLEEGGESATTLMSRDRDTTTSERREAKIREDSPKISPTEVKIRANSPGISSSF